MTRRELIATLIDLLAREEAMSPNLFDDVNEGLIKKGYIIKYTQRGVWGGSYTYIGKVNNADT